MELSVRDISYALEVGCLQSAGFGVENALLKLGLSCRFVRLGKRYNESQIRGASIPELEGSIVEGPFKQRPPN